MIIYHTSIKLSRQTITLPWTVSKKYIKIVIITCEQISFRLTILNLAETRKWMRGTKTRTRRHDWEITESFARRHGRQMNESFTRRHGRQINKSFTQRLSRKMNTFFTQRLNQKMNKSFTWRHGREVNLSFVHSGTSLWIIFHVTCIGSEEETERIWLPQSLSCDCYHCDCYHCY